VKAEVKAQWIADLRSGEYEQGKGNLRRTVDGTEHYCCLGVLCEQAVKASAIPAPELHDHGVYVYLDDECDGDGGVTGESFNQECALPRKVAEWAGIPVEREFGLGEDVVIMPEDAHAGEVTAIGANDGMALPFLEIADLIEKNVPVTE
jgi:hypothetical protein